jgi:hypothetical protein
MASPVRSQAIDTIAEAWKETMKTVGIVFEGFFNNESAAREQLTQDKKNALAAISENLTDMAAAKRSVAKQLICLGETQGQIDASRRFNQCWRDFESQNQQLAEYLRQMWSNMNLADPVWCSQHLTEREAIDALYWEKVGLQRDTLRFC